MRFKIVVSIFILIWSILVVRIYFLSIKSNTFYEELAERNMVKTESLVPIRGLILDRNGEPLAVNRLGFSIALSPRLSQKQKKLEENLKSISLYFPEYDMENLRKIYLKEDSPYNHDPIKVIEFIPYENMHTIYPKIFQNSEIKISPSTMRYYPNGKLASHIIGYAGKANQEDINSDKIAKLTGVKGKSGLEREYDEYLKGELGYKKIKVTALNQEIGEIERVNPIENNNLILSIDIRLQKAMSKLYEKKNGAAIVMDVESGEILAAGSYPEYDINDFIGGISSKKWSELINSPYAPFTNKLVNGLYPPASTIKMGMALSFVEYANIDEKTSIYCPESITLGGREFRDWLKGGHGETDIIKSIKRSVDVFYYKLSLKTGIDNMARTLKNMGFGEKSGVDLPNEFIGVVPDIEWKRRRYNEGWYMGETVVASIGQGYFLVTPMQMARHTAFLATSAMPTPHFVINAPKKEATIKRENILTPTQESKIEFVREGMRQVCEEPRGTAYWYVRGIKSSIACKTGTGQVIGIQQGIKERIKEEDLDYFHRSHGWLIAYAPFENPKYAIVALVEHGGSGGSSGGEIIVKLTNKLVEYGYLEEKK